MRQGMGRGYFRTIDQVRGFVSGLELVEPGLVHVQKWRPGGTDPSTAEHPVLRLAVAAVGCKP
jgi:hypothetical protein